MTDPTLQHELRKKHPFDTPEQEALLNIFRTSDQLANRFGRLFKKHGLTSAQYNILRILRGEGTRLRSLEIADRLIAVVPGITGLLDRLEKQGLIRRERCGQDRRVVYVSITETALELLASLDQPVLDLHRKLLGHLTPDELEQVSRLMIKTREGKTD